MKPFILATALLVLPSAAYAQVQRNENLESECSTTGSGMDPRCIGDTQAGGLSDVTTERQEKAITGGTARRVIVPSSRRDDLDR